MRLSCSHRVDESLQINALTQREREHSNASQCLAFHSHEEGTAEDESYSEDALQDILEEENITEQAENLATTEEEQSSDFEGPAEVDVTFWLKDGNTYLFNVNTGQRRGSLSMCV